MTHKLTSRYCADTEAIAAMKRDGIGWGHDLECGQMEMATLNRRAGPLHRAIRNLKRRLS